MDDLSLDKALKQQTRNRPNDAHISILTLQGGFDLSEDEKEAVRKAVEQALGGRAQQEGGLRIAFAPWHDVVDSVLRSAEEFEVRRIGLIAASEAHRT